MPVTGFVSLGDHITKSAVLDLLWEKLMSLDLYTNLISPLNLVGKLTSWSSQVFA